MTEFRTDEEIAEDSAEESKYKATLVALSDQSNRYKALFGDEPDGRLSPADIHNKIAEEMKRRNLRPYKI